MTDYKQKKKPVPSRLLASFGAVTPKHKPEDWRKVRAEMEEAMAEEAIRRMGSWCLSPVLRDLYNRRYPYAPKYNFEIMGPPGS
jgi:hypothetical protein